MSPKRPFPFIKLATLFMLTSFIGFTIGLLIYATQRRNGLLEGFAFAEPSKLCLDTYYFELPGFLTHDECDALQSAALAQGMEDSKVGETDSTLDKNIRMSTQTWFKHDANEIAKVITVKTTELVKSLEAQGCFKDMSAKPGEPVSVEKHFEDIQVVRYDSMGKYDPHYDGDECGEEKGTTCAHNQRTATILMYLNDDFVGGETRFPHFEDLKIKPEKGKAVFFWVSDPETGYVFEKSLHGGDPVQQGEKWIATQWVRRNKQDS
jgi:prolyl 4-hydroxylase